MASILAILALHASRVLEEIAAKRTTHDVVKLLKHKLVTVKLMCLLFSLPNGTFTVEAGVELWTVFVLLC